MIRKTLLALAATVAVGAAMLTPTTASAWHFHGPGFYGYGYGWRVAPVVVAPVITSCYRYRWIETRRGLRRALVNVCVY